MPHQRVRTVMTYDPITMRKSTTLKEAAEAMRTNNVGGVCVVDNDGSLCGFVTDRDIVVRGIAQGMDPTVAQLDAICSRDLARLAPDDSVDDAIKLMAQKAVRRIPVIDGEHVIGILSLGDLAQARDKRSALGGISAAPPNV